MHLPGVSSHCCCLTVLYDHHYSKFVSAWVLSQIYFLINTICWQLSNNMWLPFQINLRYALLHPQNSHLNFQNNTILTLPIIKPTTANKLFTTVASFPHLFNCLNLQKHAKLTVMLFQQNISVVTKYKVFSTDRNQHTKARHSCMKSTQ